MNKTTVAHVNTKGICDCMEAGGWGGTNAYTHRCMHTHICICNSLYMYIYIYIFIVLGGLRI